MVTDMPTEAPFVSISRDLSLTGDTLNWHGHPSQPFRVVTTREAVELIGTEGTVHFSFPPDSSKREILFFLTGLIEGLVEGGEAEQRRARLFD
jgi:hypothetical protein